MPQAYDALGCALVAAILLASFAAPATGVGYVVYPKSAADVYKTSFSNITDLCSEPRPITARAPSAAPNAARHAPPYNVCISAWAPMVDCTPDGDASVFTGYHTELFRLLAKQVGWLDDDYAFACLPHSAVMADLRDPAGSCSLSASGVEVSVDGLTTGLLYSWPTYKSGLRVLIHAQLKAGSTWAFSEVFHWHVWLALGLTSVGVGILISCLESLRRAAIQRRMAAAGRGADMGSSSTRASAPVVQHGKGLSGWVWYTAARMVHVFTHVGDPESDASRVLMLGYGFLTLVMVSMYTATSASRITAQQLVHPIHGLKDLTGGGVQVLARDRHIAKLAAQYDVAATSAERDGDQGTSEMLTALRSGRFDALVLEAPVAEQVVGTNAECDLFLAGDVFETTSLALAFPADADVRRVHAFSEAIVRLQTEQSALDTLDAVYIKTGGTSKCFGGSGGHGGHGSGETIGLTQVLGLWLILAGAAAACFALTLLHNVLRERRRRAQQALMSAGGGGGGGQGAGTTTTGAASRRRTAAITSWIGGVVAPPSTGVRRSGALQHFLGFGQTFQYRDHAESSSGDGGHGLGMTAHGLA